MLEIASEIIVYLLIAATIGAAIGYLMCKSLSEKTIPLSTDTSAEKTPVEAIETVEREEKPLTEDVSVKKEETPVEEVETVEREAVIETEEVSQEVAKEEESTPDEEVEIPTEDAIGKALEALEEIDEQEDEVPEAEKEEDKKPELLDTPRNGKKDKLTRIKGIGPKLEEKLNDTGIYHFDQIAAWTKADLEWLEANTVFKSRAKNEDWIAQSKSFI